MEQKNVTEKERRGFKKYSRLSLPCRSLPCIKGSLEGKGVRWMTVKRGRDKTVYGAVKGNGSES